jgi:hypothetical protein
MPFNYLYLFFHVIIKQLYTLPQAINKFRKSETTHCFSQSNSETPFHFFIRSTLMSTSLFLILEGNEIPTAPSLDSIEDAVGW